MRLVAISGPLAGATYIVSPGLTIQSPDADDPQSCRVGALSDGALTVEGTDGTGAIFVNGLPPTARPLQPGDEIRVAGSVLIVRADEETSSAVLDACRVTVGRLEGMGACWKWDSKKPCFTRNSSPTRTPNRASSASRRWSAR
jgi:hypothetical protein